MVQLGALLLCWLTAAAALLVAHMHVSAAGDTCGDLRAKVVELSRENNRLAAELAELVLSKSAAADPPPEPFEGVGAQSCRCGEAAPYELVMQMERLAGALSTQLGQQLDRIAELIKALATQADVAQAGAQSEFGQRAAQMDGLAEQVKALVEQAGVAAQSESLQRAAQMGGLSEQVKALVAQASVAQSDAQSESRHRVAQMDGLAEQVKALAAEVGDAKTTVTVESKRRGAQMDRLTDQSSTMVAKLGDVHADVAKMGPDKSGQGSRGNCSAPDMFADIFALIKASRDEEVVIVSCDMPQEKLKPLEYFLRGAMRSPSDIRDDINAELVRVAGGDSWPWNVLLSDGIPLLRYTRCFMTFGRLTISMWKP